MCVGLKQHPGNVSQSRQEICASTVPGLTENSAQFSCDGCAERENLQLN